MATAFRSCLESREMTRGPIFWAAFAPEEEEVATASGDLSHCVLVKVSSRPLKKVPTTTPRSGAKGRPTTEPHSETALCRRGQVQTVLEGHEDNVMCAAVLSAISGRVGGRALAFCSVSASCSLRGELVAGWPETSHRLARPLRAALGGAGGAAQRGERPCASALPFLGPQPGCCGLLHPRVPGAHGHRAGLGGPAPGPGHICSASQSAFFSGDGRLVVTASLDRQRPSSKEREREVEDHLRPCDGHGFPRPREDLGDPDG